MILRLHERRTPSKIVRATLEHEGACLYCKQQESVEPDGPLVQNAQGLRDDHGHPMLDQQVTCTSCGKKWVDVFYRVYDN